MPSHKGKRISESGTRTQKELAEAWGRSPRRIRELTTEGILPRVQRGKRLVYPWPETARAYEKYLQDMVREDAPPRAEDGQFLLSQSELAEKCGCTPQWISQLTAQGVLPTRREGGRKAFPYPEARFAYLEHQASNAEKKSTTLDAARLRKLLGEADLVELKAQELRGGLVSMEVFRGALDQVLGVLRGHLRALPGHWGPEIVGVKSVKDGVTRLKPLVAELIKALAEVVSDVSDYDRDQ